MKIVHKAIVCLLAIASAGCGGASGQRIDVRSETSDVPENAGIVADKSNGRVLLVQSAGKADLLGGYTQKIIQENDGHAIWVKIPSEDYAAFSKGDAVRYSSAGPQTVDFSMPAQTEADDAELLSAADWNDEERDILEQLSPQP